MYAMLLFMTSCNFFKRFYVIDSLGWIRIRFLSCPKGGLTFALYFILT